MEKKQSPELATPSNDRVQNLPPLKNGRVQNLPPLNSPKFWTLPIFGGGKLWTQSFQRVASSGLCCFSPFWHIGKLGGGKNSGPPCIFTTVLPRGNIGCKRIPVTSARLRKNGNMWKSLGGILLNIVPREDPRPKTLGACGPSGFCPLNCLGTIFTSIPPRLFHILYQ